VASALQGARDTPLAQPARHLRFLPQVYRGRSGDEQAILASIGIRVVASQKYRSGPFPQQLYVPVSSSLTMRRINRCNFRLPATAVLGLLMLSQSLCAAPADRSVLNRCRNAFAGTAFDCVCPIRFLSKNFNQVDAGLILMLWGYSIDEHHNHDFEIQRLASKYGTSRIDNLLYRFHGVRVDMLRQCPSDTPEDGDAY
jgi:hypothetical protein